MLPWRALGSQGPGCRGLGAPSPMTPAQRKWCQRCRLSREEQALQPDLGVCAQGPALRTLCPECAGLILSVLQRLPMGFGRTLSSFVFVCTPCWGSLILVFFILFFECVRYEHNSPSQNYMKSGALCGVTCPPRSVRLPWAPDSNFRLIFLMALF